MIWTIWIALALFVAGELRRPWLFLIGSVCAAIHLVWAMSAAYGWDHTAAAAATAAQTNAVFGINWRGGLYVNYLFVGIWIADALARIAVPARRSRALVWTLRTFYFVIIVNGAVIFARPERRWLGVVACGALIVAWTSPWSRRGASGASGDRGEGRAP